MPKKKKTADKADPHEGRPVAGVTLGDFIKVKVSQSQRKQNAQGQQQQNQQENQEIQGQQQQQQPKVQSEKSGQREELTVINNWPCLGPTAEESTSSSTQQMTPSTQQMTPSAQQDSHQETTSNDAQAPTAATISFTPRESHIIPLPTTDVETTTTTTTAPFLKLKPAAAPPPYFVCRTKKGGVPVKVESRSSGKKVTLVEHVGGDGKGLAQMLKNRFGTGGLYKDGVVELQGDCLVKVSKYLNENKQLLKPFGTKTV